ncbi:MAG: hypothetical protein A2W01_10605 [Candidatus Solincola sediminis]|uniref:Uncharacterized protein n=1 Tax=Candidatus Solincola sediminis TaxID=1797199 RepID=A0A1F2WME3_9ACTN|nr:MAG: hypothetical protein A2Y75_12450 [Candidatus Solincola sediminis]OFW61355.1 MAG: hypothetical protein A2W01_10605 [Candidatus Solincola sediminis]
MIEVNLCSECGVPEPFSDAQVWLNNGDIVQKLNPHARIGFIESQSLDPLFANMAEIIGVSIEHLIINITARMTEAYTARLIPSGVRDMIVAGEIKPTTFIEPLMTYCHAVGYGKYEVIGHRYEKDEDDYLTVRIMKPFSIPMSAGALAGALSSVVGGEHEVTYEEISPGVYEFTTHWTEYPKGLREKLELQPYYHQEGDIQLDLCPKCGVPRAFARYKWNLEKGIIVNESLGRRMVLMAPQSLDRLFEELAAELGKTIEKIVVEAQRLFTKTGFYSLKKMGGEEELRLHLALRGLGNLREMKISPKGLLLRLENTATYLMTVGLMQGLFEMSFGMDSRVEWEVSKKGNLVMEAVPR